MAKPVPVKDDEFEKKVLQAEQPVVVDFWAPWCGPCRAIASTLDKLAGEYEGKLTIAKVNTDEDPRWAGQLGIQGIPTLIIFKDGKEVKRLVGSRTEGAYREHSRAPWSDCSAPATWRLLWPMKFVRSLQPVVTTYCYGYAGSRVRCAASNAWSRKIATAARS